MGSQKTEWMQRTRLSNLCSPIFPHIKCEHLVLWTQNQTLYCSCKCATQRRKSLSHWLCSCFFSPWHSWPSWPHEHTAGLSYQVVLPFLHNYSLWCTAYTLAWVTPLQVKDFALPLSNFTTLLSGHPLQPGDLPAFQWQRDPQCRNCSHQPSVNIDRDTLRVPSFTKFKF